MMLSINTCQNTFFTLSKSAQYKEGRKKVKEDTFSKAGLSHHNDPRPANQVELLLLQFCQTEPHEVI